MCSNIGTPNNHHFPFGTNGKVVVLGVPILKHFRVYVFYEAYTVKKIHRFPLPVHLPLFLRASILVEHFRNQDIVVLC